MPKRSSDKPFLSQVPSWDLAKVRSEIGTAPLRQEWRHAKAGFGKHTLTILGCAVMEDWETPYMLRLAEVACSRGGRVLELGFGMGISAKFIQQYPVAEHIIIEANSAVAKKARSFARRCSQPVRVLEGFWEDVIHDIPDNTIDGILFDTYPLSDAELYQNHFRFFPFAFAKLRPGGVFTYYSDEAKRFGKVHRRKLQDAGFKPRDIKGDFMEVSPPPDCEYWRANTMLVPAVRKEDGE